MSAQDWNTFLKESRAAALSLWETSPLTPCMSRWPSAFLALTGTPWDKDVHCHGDHIQENAGKEGRRRCNIKKYRFGPGERLYLLFFLHFFFYCLVCVFFLMFTCSLNCTCQGGTRQGSAVNQGIVACHYVFHSCFMALHYISLFFQLNPSLNLTFSFPLLKFVGNFICAALLNARR